MNKPTIEDMSKVIHKLRALQTIENQPLEFPEFDSEDNEPFSIEQLVEAAGGHTPKLSLDPKSQVPTSEHLEVLFASPSPRQALVRVREKLPTLPMDTLKKLRDDVIPRLLASVPKIEIVPLSPLDPSGPGFVPTNTEVGHWLTVIKEDVECQIEQNIEAAKATKRQKHVRPLKLEVERLLFPFWDYLRRHGSCGSKEQVIYMEMLRESGPLLLPEIIAEFESIKFKLEVEARPQSEHVRTAQEGKTVEGPVAENVFMKDGASWVVKFRGEPRHIDDSAGMPYIKLLLSRKGEAFSTGKFLSAYNETSVTLAGGDKELSKEAIGKCRERLKDIDREADEAKKDNDFAAQKRLEDEKVDIKTELLKAAGFAGRGKQLNPEHSKYRLKIGHAITRAIKKIREHLPKLADHLADSISPYSSTSLSYRPKEPIEWTL